MSSKYFKIQTPVMTVGPFPALHKADQYPGDDNAYFKLRLRAPTDGKVKTDLVAKFVEAAQELGCKMVKGKPAKGVIPLKALTDDADEPTGEFELLVTTKSAPMLVDSKGNPMGKSDAKGQVKIGAGSRVRVKLSCDQGTKGQIRCYLDSVQIAKIETYSEGAEQDADYDELDEGDFVAGESYGSIEDEEDEGEEDLGDDGALEI